ncbi:molybdopterin molybdochelatase [Longilinea arvoryzae]|uniref:Molybdopterin molybdenumtransferase n=1 Tax=Longilinea arvoryzae TaxID=360412 RepID=A0A0S7BI64_9CHLR|nr:gephyrin-like molybdotransferase Glp [Longilinea arvoryzae]GAP14864.1 molybdopterin molybdochelatase [Longilinea arvoryzae]
MPELLSVSKAQSIILDAIQTLATELIPIQSARSRRLATPIITDTDLPPFTNSSADGFAVQAADTLNASSASPVVLTIIGDIPAGTNPAFRVNRGQAARIMTGAPLPEGADAVVMVEATDIGIRGLAVPIPRQVRIFSPILPGDSLRPRGQDLTAGTQLFPAGHRLRPPDIGLLASLGIPQVQVYRQPRIALLSTGDELLDPSKPLQPGKIHDANSYLLASVLQEHGAVITHMGFVGDDEVAIRESLENYAASGIDLLITSAGVSVGAYDYVRKIITEQGDLTFWRVNMRPGKPLAFGRFRNVPVIGLPGNPVSAFVSCLIFVLPALNKMSGAATWFLDSIHAKLLEPVESDGRESYLRAILENQHGNWFVKLAGQQSSGNLFVLTRSNALLILPSEVKSLPTGAEVNVYPLFPETGWD